jgi:hypothetical protein
MTNKILANKQYGFRSNSSTEITSHKLITEILNALNSKILVARIFCDLKKAFDCINYEILQSELELYGAVGKPMHW